MTDARADGGETVADDLQCGECDSDFHNFLLFEPFFMPFFLIGIHLYYVSSGRSATSKPKPGRAAKFARRDEDARP